MTSHHHGYPHEHEHEPQYGLPEALPANERILWQGSPNAASLARHGFHVRKLVAYFAVIIALRVVTVVADGGGANTAMVSALWLSMLAAFAIGVLSLMAWLIARTTVYTITSRRVVMRIGIVLSVTFNLPFKRIASAGLRRLSHQTGDIPLALMAEDQIAYLNLWPHARPWRFSKTEPMLRSVTNAEQVAEILSRAWRACVGEHAQVTAEVIGIKGPEGPAPGRLAGQTGRTDQHPGGMRTA